MKLTVKQLHSKLAGRGIAAVNEAVLKKFGVREGQHLGIRAPTGEDVIVAVRRCTEEHVEDDFLDEVETTIALDHRTMRHLGVGEGVNVDVEPLALNRAMQAVIRVPEAVLDDHVTRAEIRQKLLSRAVYEGWENAIPVGTADQDELEVEVLEVAPGSLVYLDEMSDIEFVDSAPDEEPGPVTEAVSFRDIGGADDAVEAVKQVVTGVFEDADVYDELGTKPPTGVLLHGPPGTGKTRLAKAVANEVDAHFATIQGPEVFDKFFGESERKVRDVFETARENAPAVIYVDEIDAIAGERAESNSAEQRVVTQLLTLMDGLASDEEIVVLASTNRVDALDDALRRPGRFDREVEVPLPDESGRREILAIHTRGTPLGSDVSLDDVAARTHGYSGADLAAVVQEATCEAVERVRDGDGAVVLRASDVEAGLEKVDPSGLRAETFDTPDVSWDDVGGLEEAKQVLQESIEWPLQAPDVFEAADLEPASGILLHGPPGTGKSLLAKAVAAETDANFLSVAGPELLDKWVGESERKVRALFERARAHAPCVVFFDEIDALARRRSDDAATSDGVVTQLLTELDGMTGTEGVTVIATTNRIDRLDEAFLRPGRFDATVHVGLPETAARREIFRVHLQDRPTADIEYEALAEATDGFSGADIAGACRLAARYAVREVMGGDTDTVEVSLAHLRRAIEETSATGDGDTEPDDRRNDPGFA